MGCVPLRRATVTDSDTASPFLGRGCSGLTTKTTRCTACRSVQDLPMAGRSIGRGLKGVGGQETAASSNSPRACGGGGSREGPQCVAHMCTAPVYTRRKEALHGRRMKVPLLSCVRRLSSLSRTLPRSSPLPYPLTISFSQRHYISQTGCAATCNAVERPPTHTHTHTAFANMYWACRKGVTQSFPLSARTNSFPHRLP